MIKYLRTDPLMEYTLEELNIMLRVYRSEDRDIRNLFENFWFVATRGEDTSGNELASCVNIIVEHIALLETEPHISTTEYIKYRR